MASFNPFIGVRSLLKRASLSLVLLVLATASSAQVNVTASAGTANASYSTLKAAFDAINAGTHQGTIAIGITANTTETATAALNNSGAGAAVYTSVTISPSGGARIIEGSITGAILRLNGADNVTIDGRIAGSGRNLTIRNNSTASATAAIWLSSVAAGNGCTNNIIRNCEIACGTPQNTGTATSWGILMSGTTISNTSDGVDNDNNTFRENRIIKCRHGIVTRGTTTNRNENIQVLDNIVGPTSHGVDQIGIVGIFMQSDNNSIVRGNTVQFVGGDFNTTSGGADRVGIGIGSNIWASTQTTATLSSNYTVANNIIHDIIEERLFAAAGLVLATGNGGAATGNVVSNNMIYNVKSNGTGGDQAVGIGICGSHTDQIVHNSIRMTGDVDPISTSNTSMYGSGMRISSATNVFNPTIKNNCVYMDMMSSNVAAARYYCITGTTAGFAWGTGGENNNDYYYNAANPQCLTGGLSTTATQTATTSQFTTLANWQGAYTAPAQDAQSAQADPGFVSATDLHIAGTPAALNNTGANVGIITDIDGQYRSNPPDMGADEFTTNPCAAAAGTVAPVQDCVNSQFFLDVTITNLNGSSTVNVGSDFGGNPGAAANVGLGTHQIGPFPSNTNVQVLVTSNTSALCNTSFGTYSFDCSTNGQNALSFDGVNDRVDIPGSASLNITGTGLTVEAWIYPTAFSTDVFRNSIVNKEGPSGSGYMLRCGGNGQLGFFVGAGSSTFQGVSAPDGTLSLNQWQHVAGVYDGTNVRVYKNGVQVASFAHTGTMIPSAAVTTAIGNWIQGNDRGFSGKIDEVRIWSVARSAAQLATNKDVVLCGNETGLQAYYQLNQGTAAGNNAAVTSVTDMTVNANTGTVSNMSLFGPTSNWVVGRTGLGSCLTCLQATATASLAFDCGNNQFFIDVNVSALNGASSVDVVSNYPGNPGAHLAVVTPGIYQIGPFPSTSNVQVTVENNDDAACNLSLGSFTYDCANFGQNALDFQGVALGGNDRVEVPHSASLDITGTAITLEAWIYPTAWRASSFEGSIINKEGNNSGYTLRCGANGTLSFNFGNGITTPPWNEIVSAQNALTLNTWQHVAGTFDGTTLRFYRDGVQLTPATTTLSTNVSIGSTGAAFEVTIGNWSQGDGRGFVGKIDEVRVWNIARTGAEIAASYAQQSCADVSPGLQAYYKFNQGVDGANNAVVTTLLDATANANNGTVLNMALNGPTSNWVQGKTGLTPCPACSGTPNAGTVSGPGTVCANVTGNLSLVGSTYASGLTYQWSYGLAGNPTANPLGTSALQPISAIPPGTWEVVATVTCPSFGSATTPAFAFVKNAVPTATPSSNTPVCVGHPLLLTGGTDIGTSFAWTGPNSFTSTQQNPQVSATATAAMAGTYNFTATANGCSSAASPTVVVVNPSPTIISTTATPNPICANGNSQLQVNVAGAGAYCPILFTQSDPGDDYISEVAILDAAGTTVLWSRTSGEMSPELPGYDDQTALSTLTLTAGTTYRIRVNHGGTFADNLGAWMDFNQNGDFTGTGETVMASTSAAAGASVTTTFTVPAGALNGGVRLRTASRFSTAITACNTTGFGEAEDYTVLISGGTPNALGYAWTDPNGDLNFINIANPLATTVASTTPYSVTVTGGNGCTSTGNVTLTVQDPPAATVNVVSDCPNSAFSIALDVTSVGSGTNASFTYTVNGGAPINIGPYTVASTIPDIGPFAANDVVNVTLNHQSLASCGVAYGNFYSGCPQIIDCPNVFNDSHCYGNDDPRVFHFVADNPNETLTLSFISGGMAANDVLQAFDGPDNTYPSIPNLTGNFPNLAGATGTSSGNEIYVEIDSDGSGSCKDNTPGASNWVFQVQCTPGCVQPDAAITTTPDCENMEFSIDVEVTFAGDAPSVTLQYIVNGGSPVLIPGLFETSITNIGPFDLGDDVNVRLLHDGDAACDRNFGDFSVPVSACPNDDPCDAHELTVNPNYTCAVTTPGDMTGNTLTSGITGGCAGVTQDEWFYFVATAPAHRIQLGGNTTGLSHSVYSGACGSLTLVASSTCTAGATFSTVNGLVIGQTYHVRVSRTTTGTNAYTVCVSAPPAADIGQNSLSFDGTNDRVIVPHVPSLDITGTAITLEAWIYPTSWRTNVWEGGIIVKEGGNSGYMLRAGAGGTLNFAVSRSTPTVGFNELNSTAGALTLNTWQHVAGTYDGTTQRIFINGVQVATATPATSPIVSTTNALVVGGWASDATRCFPGKIDEARVWNVTVPGATIAANMDQQLCGGETGLVAYYQFNQGIDGGNNPTETTLFDGSGNANNGSLTTGANGFALTGPTSNWVQGVTGMTPCPPCASVPTPGTITGTSPVCSNVAGHSLALQGATTGTGISYQWFYGPVGNPTANMLGTTSAQATASIPVGTWQLVVEVTCASFGTSTTPAFNFTKNPTPTATPTAGPACSGQTLNLFGGTDIGSTFTWTGPNSFTSTQQNPTIASLTTAASGTYTFNATLNGCTGTGTVAVSVTTTPTISSLTATPNPVCAGANSQLNAVALAPGYVMGSGGASFIDISSSGTAVTGTVTDDSEHDITFPGFTFNGVTYTSARIGNNGTILFNNAGGDNNYTNRALPAPVGINNTDGLTGGIGTVGNIGLAVYWDDLTPGTGASIRYQLVGNTFIVQWTNEDSFAATGTGTVTFQVQVDVVTGTIYYVYQDVVFTAGDAQSNGQSATIGLNYSSTSALQFSHNTNSLVNGQVISFVPNQASFSWSPGTYLSSTTIANPIAQNVAADITYSVTATVNGCTSAPSTLLLDTTAPIGPAQAQITPASPTFCSPGSVTLTAVPLGGGGPFTFTWTDPNNVVTGPTATATISATIGGLWSVVITDGCGSQASASTTVTAPPTPTATASSNSPVCQGQSILLNGGSDQPGSTFAWTGPLGFASNAEDPVLTNATLAMTGTYTLTVTAAGCSSSAVSTSVQVNVSPTVPVVTPPVAYLCAGSSVNLTASSTALTQVSFNGGAVQIPLSPNTGGTTAVLSSSSPFPSTVAVSGLPTSGVIVKRVFLNGVSHTFPDDMDVLLQSPTGINVVLMSDAGLGNDLVNNNFEFRDDAAGPMSDGGALPSGAYRCSNYTTTDTWFAPGPGSITQATPSLSLFTGNMNGTWNLFIADDAGGDVGSLTSWSIQFEYDNVSYTWSPAAGLNTTTGPAVTATPASTTVYTVTASNGGCSNSTNVAVNVGPAMSLQFQLDGASTETWEIRDQGTNTLVQTGTAFLPTQGTFTVNTCIPDGCFYLKVTDDGGDGITTGGFQGGYILRTAGNKRVIDNRNNFLSGAVSQIAANGGFCLNAGTVGNDRLIVASCDRLDLQRGATSACSEKLTADNTPNNTSGSVYQFWIYNPNGPESQLIPATGAGSNILSMNQVTLPAGKIYNIKVRTRISPGVYRNWGPACRMSISTTPTPCRITMLVDDATSANWSCGKTVVLPPVGGGNGAPNMLVAKPATRLNTACVEVGANKYQFRIKDVDTQTSVVVNGVGTNYYCYMTRPTFGPCKQYEVDVRASFDNGTTWCNYSEVCTVYTGGCIGGGNQNMAAQAGDLQLYPNPNRGDQVILLMENLTNEVSTVSVDIYDAFGKRVMAETIGVNDGIVNKTLDLNGHLAAGMYMVNITAGDATYVQRLVIEP